MDETEMLTEYAERIDAIADKCYCRAARLIQREGGWLDRDDFRQEARLIAVAEFRRYDPTRRPDLGRYLTWRLRRRLVDRLRVMGFDSRAEHWRPDGRGGFLPRRSHRRYLDRSTGQSIESLREKHVPFVEADYSTVETIDRWISDDRAAWAIDQLPEQERVVLTLRVFDGMTLDAIGAELGVTPPRVWQIIRDARPHLAEILRAA